MDANGFYSALRVKRPLHRFLFGYRIGRSLRIGLALLDAREVALGDGTEIGYLSAIARVGRSLWTHNRQQTAPIFIGDFCYLGSEVRLAPGARLPERRILALGTVLSREIAKPGSLVGGVPAKVIRPLDEKDLVLIRRRARDDIPADLYGA